MLWGYHVYVYRVCLGMRGGFFGVWWGCCKDGCLALHPLPPTHLDAYHQRCRHILVMYSLLFLDTVERRLLRNGERAFTRRRWVGRRQVGRPRVVRSSSSSSSSGRLGRRVGRRRRVGAGSETLQAAMILLIRRPNATPREPPRSINA